jgi:hypothetical protein
LAQLDQFTRILRGLANPFSCARIATRNPSEQVEQTKRGTEPGVPHTFHYSTGTDLESAVDRQGMADCQNRGQTVQRKTRIAKIIEKNY